MKQRRVLLFALVAAFLVIVTGLPALMNLAVDWYWFSGIEYQVVFLTELWTKVLLGVSWADIYQALRLGFGVGWSYIILAEMVDIGRGLGGIIIISQRRGPREHIYLVLLVIVALAFLTDKIWGVVGERLFPYRKRQR